MVGNNTAPGTVSGTVPDRATVAAVRKRLNGQSHRFLHVHRTVQTLSIDDLADLVAEIVTEYTDHVIGERDALAEDLAYELNATRTGTERGAA